MKGGIYVFKKQLKIFSLLILLTCGLVISSFANSENKQSKNLTKSLIIKNIKNNSFNPTAPTFKMLSNNYGTQNTFRIESSENL
jgi:hypothetical protein